MPRGSAGHRWKKGEVANPLGKPKGHISFASRMREHLEANGGPNHLLDIALAIAEGQPMVRVIDQKTQEPRLAPAARAGHGPALARPEPITMVDGDEIIHEVVWVTTAERMQALTWIANTLGIKPPAEVIMDVNQTQTMIHEIDTTALSDDELDTFIALSQKLSRPLLSEGEDEEDEDIIDAESVEVER